MKLNDSVKIICAALLAVSGNALAVGPNAGERGEITVAREVARDTSRPMRDIIAELPQETLEDPSEYVVPNQILDLDDSRDDGDMDAPSPAQRTPSGIPMPAVDLAFDGMRIGLGGGGVPPDTTGDVGPNYYFQWVNTSWALFNKDTGVLEEGPFPGNTFWAGFGGVCDTTDRGDPLVLWDDQAQRWVVSQFAFTSTAGGTLAAVCGRVYHG